MKQTAHKGHTTKHAGTHKHTQGKGKHHPAKAHKAQTHHHAHQKQHTHTAAKGPKVAKPRKLARADVPVRAVITPFASRGRVDGAAAWDSLADVACCSALALTASARLSGWPVGAEDVLDLYGHLTRDADAGASILATLEMAAEVGLAGVRPVWFERLDHGGPDFTPDQVDAVKRDGLEQAVVHASQRTPLILGLELPGPHAVTIAPDGCWVSWGAHYDPAAFPDAVIEEAWAVVWP